MFRGIVGTVNKGKDLPEEVLKKIIEQGFTSCCGLTLVMEGELLQTPADTDFEGWKKFMSEFKDLDRVFHVGQFPAEGWGENNRQPFTLVKDEKKGVVVNGVLEGDFPQFAVKDSPHSHEYHLVAKYLGPKLQKLYEHSSGVSDFMAQLTDPVVNTELTMLCQPRGVIVLLGADGNIVSFGNNELGAVHDWGTISNILEPPKASGNIIKKTLGLVRASVPATPSPDTATPSATPTDQPQKTEGDPAKENKVVGLKGKSAVVAASETLQVKYNGATIPFQFKTMPDTCDNHRKKKAWLDSNIGCYPHGWEKTRTFPVPVSAGLKFNKESYGEFRKLAHELRASADTVVDETQRQIDAGQEGTVNTEKVNDSPAPIIDPGIVPAAEKKSFHDKFLKIGSVSAAVAESRDEIINPKVLYKVNLKATTFAEQSGLRQGVYDTLGWSKENIYSFQKEHPTLAMLLINDLQTEIVALKQAAAASTSKTEEKKPVIGLKKAS